MATKSRSGDLPLKSLNVGQAGANGTDLESIGSRLNGDDLALVRYNMGHALASDFTIADANSAQGPGPVNAGGFQAVLGAGDIAVVGYNTGQTDANGSTVDSIQIVLTKDVASGTVIFMTDRTWNGSAFSVSGSDGTTTYTFAANTVAGTVINVPLNGGFDPDQNGEAIYIYQGTINTPTSFMYAIEIADGNTTFAASLTNTGLTVGTSAVGIALDSATYSGPTTEAFAQIYNGKSLLQNISDATNWVGDDADGQKALDQPDVTGPFGLSADFSVWAAAGGGGGGVVGVSGDATANSGNSGINLVQLFTNLQIGGVNVLYAPQDIVFDTVHGKYFIADSDISGGHNRVLMGNISDLIGNSGVLVAPTVLFSDAGTTPAARIFNLQVDPNNGIVYFDHGQGLDKVKYDGTGHVQLANFGTASGNPNGTTNNYIDDFVINFTTGTVYLSSHRIVAAVDGDQVSRNYIYKITGLDPTDSTGAFTFGNGLITVLPFSPDDDDSNNGITFAAGEGFPQEKGTVEGLALSPDGLTLYIATAKTLYDDNGDGGFPGDNNPATTDPILTPGGIYAYALTGNPNGTFTNFYVPGDDGDTNSQTIQTAFGPQGLLDDIEIDPVTGKLYFLDQTGDQLGATNPPGDEGIWRVDTDGTLDPVFFQGIFNINGLAPTSLFFNHAPTVISHTEATPGVTEASTGPGSGSTALVQPFLTLDVTDPETVSLTDQLAGAVVRVSANFQSGVTHQDTLTINGLTSGTLGSGITFSYNSASGVMLLSGANTFNNYEAAIALVRFNTSGDNPTAFGAATSRTISWSVSDGLNQSDEVSTNVTVTGINDAPVNNGLTGSYSAVEDTNLSLTGISVSDVDADPATQNVVVTLSVAHGALTLLTNVLNGITAGQITAGANSSATITVTATQNQINATLAAANGLVYSPTADYNGSDAITVVTNDQGFNGNDPGLTGTGSSEQDSDTKTINISAVVDIANDNVTVAEDSGANTLNLLANDTFENPNRAITSVTQGTHGTVTINDNGTAGNATDDFAVYTVTDANYNGTDSFTYTVTSPTGVTETATVNVTLTAVNDPVTGAAPPSISLSEDSANVAVSGLSISDVDATLAPAGVYNVTLSSTHGTMTLTTTTGLTFTVGDGTSDATMTFHGTRADINTALATAKYTPTADYNGTDAAGITLQVTDTFGGIVATGTGLATSDSDSISVTVTAVNDAPVFAALNGTPTFTEGGAAVTLDNNATVTDVDLAALNGGNGDYGGAVLTVARQGGANASDLFQFAASGLFTVNGSNLEAGGQVFASFTNSGGTLTISFNDSATIATSARVNAVLDAIQYANNSDNPPASAVIAYVFDDGNAGAQGTGGALTATGSATVTITPTNDAPTAVFSNHNLGPATEQTAFDLKNSGLSVGDIDGNSGSETVTLAVGQGVLNVTAGTSGAGVAGSGTGTVTITGTIAQINALLNTDGTSTISYLNSSNAPAASTSLTLTIHDNGNTGGGDLSASDSATITLSAVNDGPANTVPGTQTINEDGTLTFTGGTAISVSDPDLGAGTLTVTLSVVNGQLTLSGTAGLAFGAGDGTDDTTMTFTGTQAAVNAALNNLLYESTQDNNGSDTLTITTSDNGNTGSDPGLTGGANDEQDVDTVTINITAVADIANDSVTVGEDSGPNSLDLLANDSFENAGRTITSVTQGLHGSVTINDNGNGAGSDDFVVYTPDADYNGADSFTYTVTSGGVTETATVNVTVTATADIADDSPTTNEDSAVNVLVLGNDSFEGTPAITNVGAAAHGTAVLNDNGTPGDTSDDYIVFTPNADYNGSDSFTYTVTSGGVTETATVNVTVTAVADIANDSVSVLQDSGSNSLNLLANDSFESAARFISAVGAALHGTTAINNNGTPGNTADDFVTYTPTAGYQGPDSFTYTVTSGGVTETATVNVNVGPPDTAPVVDLNTGTAGIDDTNIYQEGGAGSGIGAAIDVSDADAGDMIHGATIALSDPETGDQLFVNLPLPGGITIDPASTDDFLILTGTATPADYTGALGQIGYRSTSDDPTIGNTHTTRSIGVTVNDGNLNSAPATMTMTVIGVDDPAVAHNDAVSTNEATVVGGNVLTNNGSGADSDVDGPPLSVSAVNGSGANVGTQITLTSGALLTLNANGLFTYDPNHAFDSRPGPGSGAVNQQAQDSFTYTLAGGGTATVIVTIAGLDSDDVLKGTAGADLLNGGAGHDQIVGLGGNDILIGGTGAPNEMIGGQGNDIYFVSVAGDTIVEQPGEGTDTIATDLASYSLAGLPNVENLVGLSGAGQILFGNGGDNLISGNSGNDQLYGGLGHDVLTGDGGNDLLSGGDGVANEMIGGLGNDTYIVTAFGDTVVEAAGEGTDKVVTNLSSYTLADNVENLIYNGAGNFTGTGNSAANTIIGGGGDDRLADGGGAADTLIGGAGNDTYVISVAGDSITEQFIGGGTDTIETALSSYQITAANVENLTGTSASGQSLTGSAIANVITGGSGGDVLDGGIGADTLNGGAGADYYLFDTVLGGGNVDTIQGFVSGSDIVLLDNSIFTAISEGSLAPGAFVIGTAAGDADDRIIYDSATGNLFYDADGNGAGAAVQFATLQGHPTLTASDFFVI